MDLEPGNIYHIYNQGNNKQIIFFRRENYFYFLKKIEQYLSQNADLLAWCLMPNHFHLIIAMKSDWITGSKMGPLNSSIAILLRSYTRAINIQENRSGSLFREKTKAIWLGSIESEKLKYQNKVGHEHIPDADEEYLFTCFRYIHQNPVKAGLVQKDTDWEYSSARDFASLREENLINKKLSGQLGLCIS